MTKTGSLDNAREFFDEVTKPCYDEFMSTPTTYKTAFSTAMSLFNISEWVHLHKKAEIEKKYGKTFASAGAFWQEVEAQVPEAGFIRDLSNASKHVKIGGKFKTSTSMSHIANTTIQSTGWGQGGFGQGRFGGGPSATMKDGTDDVSLDDCAKKVYAYWEALIEELYPTPPATITVPSGPPQANS